jgi:hypothetical protein
MFGLVRLTRYRRERKYCFRSLGIDRWEGLWSVRRLPDDDGLPLFEVNRAESLEESNAPLPLMPRSEPVVAEARQKGEMRGAVITRQMPGAASVVFMTLRDETGRRHAPDIGKPYDSRMKSSDCRRTVLTRSLSTIRDRRVQIRAGCSGIRAESGYSRRAGTFIDI